MKLEKVHRELFALLALIVLAVYLLALKLSHGILGWGDIVFAYVAASLVTALICVPAVAILYSLAAIREKRRTLDVCRERLSDISLWAWFAIPTLMAPLFLASFTVMKTLIGLQLGFGWDGFFTDLDAAIFGVDPWRITHALFGWPATIFLQFWYVMWGPILAFSTTLVPLLAGRTHSARFLLAMFLTWPATGLLFASLFASAGPCFAYLFHPDLAARFQPLRDSLEHLLAGKDAVLMASENTVLTAQNYLAKYWNQPVAAQGGGISAFPSVHVAVTVLYVFASWRILWLRMSAIAFAVIIWIGSIHFGFHYAVDGIASLAIVPVCWFAAGGMIRLVTSRHPAPERLRGAHTVA